MQYTENGIIMGNDLYCNEVGRVNEQIKMASLQGLGAGIWAMQQGKANRRSGEFLRIQGQGRIGLYRESV